MIVAEEDTSATIFLIFFHNHPVKSIDFLSLCEKTNLFSFLFLNVKDFFNISSINISEEGAIGMDISLYLVRK